MRIEKKMLTLEGNNMRERKDNPRTKDRGRWLWQSGNQGRLGFYW